jgi:hypothetical protein
MIPDPTPLPLPSLRTLGLVGLATAGVLVMKWWKRRSARPAPAPRTTVAKVIEARPLIDRRVKATELPWVDV